MATAPIKQFSLAFGCGVCLLAAAWFIHSGSGKVASEALENANDQSSFVDELVTEGEEAKASVETSGQSTGAAGDESGSPAEDKPPGSEIWFVDPELGDDFRFPQAALTPIDWDGGCSAHPFRRFSDLGSLAREGAALDPSDYFASSALPLQFTQFWSDDSSYYQFGFKWEQNTPQTFAIESYLSADRYMSANVSRYDVPQFSTRDGVLFGALQGYLKTTVKEILSGTQRKLGARIGLFRTREQMVNGSDPEFFFTQIRNAQVISINGGGLTCQKSEAGDRALCTCDARINR
jgi:hypothetical protein